MNNQPQGTKHQLTPYRIISSREQMANDALAKIPAKLKRIVDLCITISKQDYANLPSTAETLLSLKYDLCLLCDLLLNLRENWRDQYYHHLIAFEAGAQMAAIDPILVIKKSIEHSDLDEDFAQQYDFYSKMLQRLITIEQFKADNAQGVEKNVRTANPANIKYNKAIYFTDLKNHNQFYIKMENAYRKAHENAYPTYRRSMDENTEKMIENQFKFIQSFYDKNLKNKKITLEILQTECKSLLMSMGQVGEIFLQLATNGRGKEMNGIALKVGELSMSSEIVNKFIAIRAGVYFDKKPLNEQDVIDVIKFTTSLSLSATPHSASAPSVTTFSM